MHILIVDDEKLARARLQTILADCDLADTQISEAVDALQAIRILEQKTIDLVFLDINMPTMDGPTLLEEIKKHENVQKIPVILFSTSPLAAHHQTKKIDVKEYLTKPGDFNDLIKMLKRVLEIY